MSWRILVIGGLVCAALVALLMFGFGRNPHEVPFKLEGKPAPAFDLKELDSESVVSLAELKGRPVVLNFWSSWCVPCVQEHGILERGARVFGQQAEFLGVVFEDSDENARGFLDRHGRGGVRQLVDPRSATAVDFGVAGVPETYFIDASGVIRGKHVGPIDPATLEARVRELQAPVAQSHP